MTELKGPSGPSKSLLPPPAPDSKTHKDSWNTFLKCLEKEKSTPSPRLVCKSDHQNGAPSVFGTDHPLSWGLAYALEAVGQYLQTRYWRHPSHCWEPRCLWTLPNVLWGAQISLVENHHPRWYIFPTLEGLLCARLVPGAG